MLHVSDSTNDTIIIQQSYQKMFVISSIKFAYGNKRYRILPAHVALCFWVEAAARIFIIAANFVTFPKTPKLMAGGGLLEVPVCLEMRFCRRGAS